MSAMRIFASFFVAVLLVAPFAVSAVEKVPKCFLTSSTNPTGTKAFKLTSATEVDAYKNYVLGRLLCPSACYNIQAQLAFKSDTVTVAVVGTNACAPKDASKESAASARRGCLTGNTAPSISVKLIGTVVKLPPIKNRCDVQAILKSTDGGSGSTVEKSTALKAQLLEKISSIDTGSVVGQKQLSLILQNYGVSADSANEQVSNPGKAISVQEKLLAFISGDDVSAKTAAESLGLKLNGDLSDQVRLDPDKYKPVLSDSEYQQAKVHQSAVTGFGNSDLQYNFDQNGSITDLDKAKCAIATNESGSCAGNYLTIGPPTRNGGRAIGKYQVMDYNVSSWTARACGQRMTPYQFRASPDCQEKVFENVFGGYVKSCGSYAGAASKWFSGKCAIGSGGDGYTSISSYVQKFLGTFGGNNFIPFGARTSIYSSGASPFGQVNPMSASRSEVVCGADGYCYLKNPSAYTYNTVAPVGTPTGGVPQPAQTQGQVSTQSGTTAGQALTQMARGTTGPGIVTAPSVPATAVVSLIVQPTTVLAHNPISISWSSVGLKVGDKCSLLIQTTPTSTPALLAEGSEGTKRVTPESAGSLLFSIKCTNQGGAVLEKTATVSVQ